MTPIPTFEMKNHTRRKPKRNEKLEKEAYNSVFQRYGNAPSKQHLKAFRKDWKQFLKEGYRSKDAFALVNEFIVWKTEIESHYLYS